ncbi:hypothetical protein CBM2592_B100341 [Cupriavidus taiwanensis]|nr:hypothetical protein CBM2592_B100341 [Cupriavidus taiwanensis]SOY98128.1 hypothetical protein CBM2591_B80343 [Cupriavidus taiwanensis]SOZ85161.1 hypothetical protein CBM2618_B130019 [Cupriavidus taiwanensis]SPD57271.1 protein of unknown function [Cupriavidus taiwanensis]
MVSMTFQFPSRVCFSTQITMSHACSAGHFGRDYGRGGQKAIWRADHAKMRRIRAFRRPGL